MSAKTKTQTGNAVHFAVEAVRKSKETDTEAAAVEVVRDILRALYSEFNLDFSFVGHTAVDGVIQELWNDHS